MWWRRLWWWMLASIKALLTKLPHMNRSFVVLSSARSGSTLLTQLLNTHEGIVCREELLNREVLEGLQLKRADRRTIMNYILAMLLPRTNPCLPYTGFKLFNEQLRYCNLQLQEVLRDLHSPPVIVLYRENLLETYVSLQIAFQNKKWYSERRVNNCSIRVDWDDFCEYAEREKRRWKESMAVLKGAKKILVTYDQIAGNCRNETMYRLFAFLDLPLNHKCSLVSACVRQNPLQLERKVVNYHEIMKRAQESEYSIMIKLKDL